MHKHVNSLDEQQIKNLLEPEKFGELLYTLEQIIDQLICEEHEREKLYPDANLRNVDVDEKTAAKLDKDKIDCIQNYEHFKTDTK